MRGNAQIKYDLETRSEINERIYCQTSVSCRRDDIRNQCDYVFCDELDTGWTVQYGKSIKPGSSKNFRRTLQSGQTGICSVRYVSEKSDAW